MEEGRNEGGKQQREGRAAGLTGFNLPPPPRVSNPTRRGDFIGVCASVCALQSGRRARGALSTVIFTHFFFFLQQTHKVGGNHVM